MNRFGWLIPAAILGAWAATASPASAQRCPCGMNVWARVQQQSWNYPVFYANRYNYPATFNYQPRNLYQSRSSFVPRSSLVGRGNLQTDYYPRTGSIRRSFPGLNSSSMRTDRQYSVRYQTQLQQRIRNQTFQISRLHMTIPRAEQGRVVNGLPTLPRATGSTPKSRITVNTKVSISRQYLQTLTRNKTSLVQRSGSSILTERNRLPSRSTVNRRNGNVQEGFTTKRSVVPNRTLIPKTSAGKQGNGLSMDLVKGKRTIVQLQGRMDFNCAQCHGPRRPPASPLSIPQTPRVPVSPVLVRLPMNIPLNPSPVQWPGWLPRSPVAVVRLPSVPLDPSVIDLARRLVPPSRIVDKRDREGLDTPPPSRSVHAHKEMNTAAVSAMDAPLTPPPLPALAISRVQLPPLSPSAITTADPSELPADRGVVFRPPPLPPLPATAS